jgi:predicted MFS family arabinose efflux permease
VAPASAPDLARDLGLSPGIAAGAMITAFHALALVIEAPLLAWADRGRVRFVSSASLFAVAAIAIIAAFAKGPFVLLFALALYGPAVGCATTAAEGLLVESAPHERERTMTRWTLSGVAGDLAVPLLLALLARFGLGWRTAMVVASIASLVLAVVHARSRELDRPMSTSDEDDDSSGTTPVRELLRVLQANPVLVGWSLAGVGVGLLDEVLVAFAAVHLDAFVHASASWRSAAIVSWTLGGVAGLFTLDRVLARVTPQRVLRISTAIAALSLAVFACARSPLVSTIALGFVGASSAAFHPIAKARAYASLPGRPALVNAVASLLMPLDAIAPLILAAVAVRAGSKAAVFGLLVAPVGIGLAAFGRAWNRGGDRNVQ